MPEVTLRNGEVWDFDDNGVPIGTAPKRTVKDPLRAASTAEAIRAPTPYERANESYGFLNPLAQSRNIGMTGGAAAGTNLASKLAAVVPNPYAKLGLALAGGLIGGMGGNLAGQGAQAVAPGYLGNPPEDPLTTAATETLIDRGVSGGAKFLGSKADAIKKALLGGIFPNSRDEAGTAALQGMAARGMQFDSSQTTGSKLAGILEGLFGGKGGKELRVEQQNQLTKESNRLISKSGGPFTGLDTRPSLFAERSGVPFNEFESLISSVDEGPLKTALTPKKSGKVPTSAKPSDWTERLKLNDKGVLERAKEYIGELPEESSIRKDDLKARFLQKIMKDSSSTADDRVGLTWNGKGMEERLRGLSATYKYLFNSEERAALNQFAYAAKLLNPKESTIGKAAIGFRAGGAAIAVGSGLLTPGDAGDKTMNGVSTLLAIGGAGMLAKRLLLNPRTARLLGDLGKTPADNAYAASRAKGIFRALKGMQFIGQNASGDPIAVVEFDDTGKAFVRQKLKKVPGGIAPQ